MVRETLKNNWFYVVLVAFLIVFPHLIGWFTGEGPFGIEMRGRIRPVGQSIFWQGVFIETFVFAILAMSYNLVFGFAGVLSLGHALFFGLGGYTMGIVLQLSGIDNHALGLILGIVAGVLLAGLAGLFVGLASLRLKGVYFAIFSLAIAEMAFIWVGRWGFTSAEDGFALSDLPFNPTVDRLSFYYIALSLLVATFLVIRRLMNSPTGKVLLAVRENEDRAQAIGYNTLTYKLMAIVVASMMAAGAGILWVMFNKKVGPEMMSVNFTIDPLLMTIIGGVGSFAGPVVGAAGLQLTERYFAQPVEFLGLTVNLGEHWSLVLGTTFIVVVLIFPQGIVGTLNRWWFSRQIGRASCRERV